MPSQLRIDTILRVVDRVSRPVSRIQQRIGRMTRSMRRGLERVDRVTGKLARTLGRGLKIAAAAAAAGAAILGATVNRLTDEMDNLVKTTRRLKFPIEEFQEWRFVAQQSGVSNEGFTKSLETFSKRVGEARMGLGTLYTALNRNNKPLLEQLKNTNNVSEAFEIYLKEIRSTKDPMDQMAKANLGFGRSGKEIINITHNSSNAIAALRAEMQANGVVTEAQARSAEAYVDAVSSMKGAIEGLVRSAVAPLIPLLTTAARKIRVWANANRELISGKILEWGQKIVDNWSEIVSEAKRIGKIVVLIFAVAGAVKVLIGVMTALNAVMLMNPIVLITGAIIALIAAIAAAVKWSRELVAWFEEMPKPLRLLLFSIMPVITFFYLLAKAANFFKDNWEVISEFVKNSAVSVANAWVSFKNFWIDLWNDILGIAEQKINTLINTGPISWLIAASLATTEAWKAVGQFFSDLWPGIVSLFDDSVQAISDGPIETLLKRSDFVSKKWETMTGIFDTVWNALGKAFDRGVERIQNGPLSKLFGVVDTLKTTWGTLTGVFDALWGAVTTTFQATVDRFMKIIEPVTTLFKKIQEAKADLLDENIGEIKLGGRVSRDLTVYTRTKEDGIFDRISKSFKGTADKIKAGIKVVGDIHTNSQIAATNAQTKKLVQTMNKNSRDLARITNTRLIDVTAPYRHFLRVAGEPEEMTDQRSEAPLMGPAERVMTTHTERSFLNKSEVTIMDETGRAEVTKGKLGSGLTMRRTGSF